MPEKIPMMNCTTAMTIMAGTIDMIMFVTAGMIDAAPLIRSLILVQLTEICDTLSPSVLDAKAHACETEACANCSDANNMRMCGSEVTASIESP